MIQGPEHWKHGCEAMGKAKVGRKASDAWELGASLPFHELTLHRGEGLPLGYPPMLEIKDSLIRALGKQDQVCSPSQRHRGLWNVLRTKARLGTSLGQPNLYKLPEGTGKLCLSRDSSYVEKHSPVTVTKKQYCSWPQGRGFRAVICDREIPMASRRCCSCCARKVSVCCVPTVQTASRF